MTHHKKPAPTLELIRTYWPIVTFCAFALGGGVGANVNILLRLTAVELIQEAQAETLETVVEHTKQIERLTTSQELMLRYLEKKLH